MKVSKLLKMLSKLDQNKDILISSDEEGNNLYEKGYIDKHNKFYYRLYVVKGTEYVWIKIYLYYYYIYLQVQLAL